MAKARQVKRSGKLGAAVFNMASPVSRVQAGEAEVKLEDGKVIKWGAKDDLCFEYLRLVAESSTASSCMRKKQAFIFADGFTDPDAATFEVNETQTADALLQDASGDTGVLSGIALRVRYVDGKVYADNLPFECVRKLDNGFILFNPTLGQKKVDKALNEILPAYSTREKLLEQATKDPEGMASTGQVYYFFEKIKGAYDYPIPVYASKGGLADIETDVELAIHDNDEVKSGFRPSASITTIGDYSESYDEDGNLIPNSELESIQDTIKSFTRREEGEARKKVLHLTAPTQEMVPKIDFFNGQTFSGQMTDATERIANKVCRACNVPPILIGMAKPGQLGQMQEAANMIKIFNMEIVGIQNMLQRIFAELWPEVQDWTISTLNPIDYIPSEVLAKMTDAEIRALGGLAEIESSIPTDTERTLTALNALSPLVANKVLESMTETEIRALIALPPKAEENAANNQTATN